jgi:choline dehydrogenase-like flavoprotein
MASTYGVPEGASLADWPIAYEDLAPFYERAEHELGVCGDADKMRHLPPFNKPYPMPPQSVNAQGSVLRRGLDALGWHYNPVPLAINSVPYNGRAACYRCQHCVGFACPVDAKNGTQNTTIPRALLTGRCTLAVGVLAEQVAHTSGSVWGVHVRDTLTGETHTVKASVVVVAGGAIETARLLLASGLGNDHVGRHLQGHYYPGASGRFPEPVWDGQGPGPSTAMCKFIHHNPGVIGGGMLADDFIPLPITVWKRHVTPDVPRWGQAAKNWMRENFRYITEVKGPVQEIPTAHARVTLDPQVRDKWGNPVARLSGATHEETVRTSAYMFDRAVEWLKAAGAVEIWGGAPTLGLSGGQHQAGTCRMGHDPSESATDPHCRLHGHDNLYIGDGAVHVTNGPFNPFLTIMACAYRTAAHIQHQW